MTQPPRHYFTEQELKAIRLELKRMSALARAEALKSGTKIHPRVAELRARAARDGK